MLIIEQIGWIGYRIWKTDPYKQGVPLLQRKNRASALIGDFPANITAVQKMR